MNIFIKPEHSAADAFWDYWKDNGETGKHGYYESTWGAINAALGIAGVVLSEEPVVTKSTEMPVKVKGKFDRVSYQREYMRKRRENEKS